MGTVVDLIKIAEAEVGYMEKKSNAYLDSKTANAGYNNYTKYARDLDNIENFYNGKKNGYSWCDVFVDWLFVQTFGVKRAQELLGQKEKSLGASVTYSKQYFEKQGRYFKSNPKIGDQIMFKNSSGSMQHTGIVYNVDSQYVYTIEGNTSSDEKVVANGGMVCKKKYKLNNKYIDGYGRPNYTAEELKTAETYVERYVCNVDDEGLVIHKEPGGADTNELLKAGTCVKVYENTGYWSRIGDKQWVFSMYLSKTPPKTKMVFNVKRPPLNVRASYTTEAKIVGKLYNGDNVQVYKTKRGFSKVSKDEERWVSSTYLK